MTITAIETEYRGHRFRSRLEARWAVAFDHLNIKWEYESQGYLVGEDQRPYLPDFWLPRTSIWVEVKGDPGALDPALMMDAVDQHEGLPGDDPWGQKSILILGDIPDPTQPFGYLHWMVSSTSSGFGCAAYCKCSEPRFGQVTFRHFTPEVVALAAEKVAREDEKARVDAESITDMIDGASLVEIGRSEAKRRCTISGDFVTPLPCAYLLPDAGVHRAFRAARSARFEHGEKPNAA